MQLSEVLSGILNEEKKIEKTENVEVSAVFVSVLTKDGYLRCIPWTEKNTIYDFIDLLSNGFLYVLELVELAKNLVEIKCQDPEEFERVYASIKQDTEFDKYETLEKMMEEIINDLDLEDVSETYMSSEKVC